jgi:hypothetical protein
MVGAAGSCAALPCALCDISTVQTDTKMQTLPGLQLVHLSNAGAKQETDALAMHLSGLLGRCLRHAVKAGRQRQIELHSQQHHP